MPVIAETRLVHIVSHAAEERDHGLETGPNTRSCEPNIIDLADHRRGRQGICSDKHNDTRKYRVH